MERNPKRNKKITTAFYLVSSIQYDVSDTMHCDQTGHRKKKKNKNKEKNLLHIHTKLSRNFNFMKNNSKVDESKIYEPYIYIYKKKTISALSTGYFTFKGVWCSESFRMYCLSAHLMWPRWLKCVVSCL